MNGNGRSGKAGGPFPIARIYGMAPKKIVNIIYVDPARGGEDHSRRARGFQING